MKLFRSTINKTKKETQLEFQELKSNNERLNAVLEQKPLKPAMRREIRAAVLAYNCSETSVVRTCSLFSEIADNNYSVCDACVRLAIGMRLT